MSLPRLNLLGGVELRSGSDAPVEVPTKKARALLAYLALHLGQAVPREMLAGLLWGDSDDQRALANLRQTLLVLRKALDTTVPSLLSTNRDTLSLDPAGIEVDALRFEHLALSEVPEELETAIALYRGDLADGLQIHDPSFEFWLEEERRRLRTTMSNALFALAESRREAKYFEAALSVAQRLIVMEPLQERAHRLVMTLYGELGQRDAALQEYERCRALLKAELGVAPEAETEALVQALRGNGPAAAAGVPSPRSAASARAADQSESAPTTHPPEPRRRPVRWHIAAALLLMILAGVSLAWVEPWAPAVEPAALARMAFPLPDKPSIAVLPFDNLSADPEQAYFTDGFADDVITDLSKLSGLFVIARNSTLVYRDDPVPIRQVAEELGVRYVLEGSVRRVGDQVRINTQLIDAVTGGHLWAERYDVPLSDVLAVQDSVTQEVVAALEIQLTEKEQVAQARRGTKSPEAYDALLKGREYHRQYTRESFPFAILYYEKAITLDPDYSAAHTRLGVVYWEAADENWASHLGLTYDEAVEKARRHLAEGMKNPNPMAYYYATKTHSNEGRYDEAIAASRDLIALYPNDRHGYKALGRALNKAGRAAEAIEPLIYVMRLDPRGDDLGWVSYRLGESFYLSGGYEEAAEAFARSVERNQNEWSYFFLAASYGQLGRSAEAGATLEAFNSILSDAGEDPYTLARLEGWAFKNPADRLRVQEGARKAGLAEGVATAADLDLAQDGSPAQIEGAVTIDASNAKELIDQGVAVIDVRETENWNVGHIFGAVHLPLFRELTQAKLLDFVAKDQSVIFVDSGASSSRAARAAARAVYWGYTQVYFFRDGFAAWKAAGYPIQMPPT